jgi:ABC-type multidrug transport system ATPase subunit
MDEAAKCDKVVLMQTGNILSINTPKKIIEEFPRRIFSVKSTKKVEILHHLRKLPGSHSANLFGDSIHYIQKMPEHDEIALEDMLKLSGYPDVKVERIQPAIEDCFMELMKSKTAA